MLVIFDEPSAFGKFEQRHALLRGSTSDDEEIPAIRFRESPVAFGKIGGDGERSAIELIGEVTVSARKALGQRCRLIGKVNRPLVDLELLEKERHLVVSERARVDSREETEESILLANDRWTTPVVRCATLYSLLSIRLRRIGVTGFEPAASCSQSRRSAKLSYTPRQGLSPQVLV